MELAKGIIICINWIQGSNLEQLSIYKIMLIYSALIESLEQIIYDMYTYDPTMILNHIRHHPPYQPIFMLPLSFPLLGNHCPPQAPSIAWYLRRPSFRGVLNTKDTYIFTVLPLFNKSCLVGICTGASMTNAKLIFPLPLGASKSITISYP